MVVMVSKQSKDSDPLMKISQVIARELYDAQGWPTVQCEIILDSGECVAALSPAGTSVGEYEAVELRDRDTRMDGKGVRKSIELIEQVIAPLLVGHIPRALELDLKMIELDDTDNKSRLGANTMLAVSQALYRAEALSHDMELYELFAALFNVETVMMPVPMLNVINGGAHAHTPLRIQEFMIVPVSAPTFRAGLEVAIEGYHVLGKVLSKRGKIFGVGAEGGYSASFANDFEALDVLHEVIQYINAQYSIQCMIALDVAASQWPKTEGRYLWNNTQYNSDELVDFYKTLVSDYPIYSLEDPLDQNDWYGWQTLTHNLGSTIQIVGDDLFVTNVERISRGIDTYAATAAIIKPNQIGTITETLQALLLCKDQSLNTIVSHRSSDTEDTFIADLVVGTSAGQFKSGAPCRSERMAKYNRLLVIEDTLTFSDL